MGERDIERLLQFVAKHLGREWVGSVEWLRSLPQNSVDEIERRLVAGDISGVVKEIESAALRFAAESQAQYQRAGREGARWLDAQVPDKLIRFDSTGSRAEQRARQNQYELVRDMTQGQRESIRAVMADSTGRNPRDLARDIRSTIGLTPAQTQHVLNYRRQLEQGQYADAMARRLHDGRSDARLRRGDPLTPEQIERMTERYRANYIAYRAETIARTESARNVHEGLAEAYTQAIERGDIEAGELVKEWIPGPSTEDARPEHRSGDLLRQRPTMNEPFVLSDGTRMMFPGSGADAEHTANCRCTWAVTLEAKNGSTTPQR